MPRDARLLAAQGALAPRAHEQLAILVLLLGDSDAEIRSQADNTLKRIPVEALQSFLARSDVSVDLARILRRSRSVSVRDSGPHG